MTPASTCRGKRSKVGGESKGEAFSILFRFIGPFDSTFPFQLSARSFGTIPREQFIRGIHLSQKKDLSRYRTKMQAEIDSAALYRAMQAVEKSPQVA